MEKTKRGMPGRIKSGEIVDAEVHWYEGHGIGKKEIKIKKYL